MRSGPRHNVTSLTRSAQSPTSAPLHEQVHEVLELIRPAVQADGGDVELVQVLPSGAVQVRFHGACVGCPSNAMTLQNLIEENLRTRVPGVTGIQVLE